MDVVCDSYVKQKCNMWTRCRYYE